MAEATPELLTVTDGRLFLAGARRLAANPPSNVDPSIIVGAIALMLVKAEKGLVPAVE